MPNGDLKRVVQLQTKEWPDLTAPKEPRYNQKTLLQYFTFVPGFCWTLSTDLTTYQKKSVNIFSTKKTKNRSSTDPSGTILVHCSAGVGRTGTFIAVYKLWLDYLNPEVTKLSIMDTVVAMRRQRCLMVQKKEQYTYIAKCLRLAFLKKENSKNPFFSFIVSVEKGGYYEGDEDEYYEIEGQDDHLITLEIE